MPRHATETEARAARLSYQPLNLPTQSPVEDRLDQIIARIWEAGQDKPRPAAMLAHLRRLRTA